jgi:PDZ domain-containing protein
VKRFSWPGLAVIAGALLLLAAGVLYVAPSNEYIFLPDQAHALAPLVRVQGEEPDRDGGGIYYVAVDVRKASLLEKLAPGLHDGATLVPEDQVVPEGIDERTRRQTELQEMARSQKYAAAVALRQLGYKVKVEPRGALIESIAQGYPAEGKLLPDDVIVAVGDEPVRSASDLTRLLGMRKPGDVVPLRVRRGKNTVDVRLRTVENPREPGRPFLGVIVVDDADVMLPVNVNIDLGSVGGPSAGLAFALDLAEELGKDVDHGLKVAATGEILLDGSVREVGGIKQKTIAARQSGMDVFLVPVENAAEARRYADGLRIVPVDSFQHALQKLATIARET